jgi:MSHA biogenesis protein MshI
MKFNPFRRPKAPITIGIQLSAAYISLLVLDYTDAEQPVIKDYVNYPIENDASVEKLLTEINTYIEDNHLKGTNCCLVLDDKDYQMLSVDPPKVPTEEMAEAVKWKIKDLIQFPVNEAVVDIFSRPEINGVSQDVVDVVVAHKNIIDRKTDFIKKIDLHLVAIDIPELCYRNYFESTEYHDSNIALVSVRELCGKLVVINKGNVCFSRSFHVDYKGGLFDDIPENEIVLELQRSLDYYERQMKQVMPSLIVFVGENLVDDKITDITKESFNQKIIVENITGFSFSEEDSVASARVMASYGASLRQGLLTGVSGGKV